MNEHWLVNAVAVEGPLQEVGPALVEGALEQLSSFDATVDFSLAKMRRKEGLAASLGLQTLLAQLVDL